MIFPKEDIEKLKSARHPSPLSILGRHITQSGRSVVRAFVPDAAELYVLSGGNTAKLEKVDTDGFFAAEVEGFSVESPYMLKAVTHSGGERVFHDPYCFGTLLSDYDIHLIAEGTHYRKYEKLGAHLRSVSGVDGVHFAVWAPNASGVSVIGDFNSWDGRCHPLNSSGGSGLWEIFVPGLSEGAIYKYEIKSSNNLFIKTDPYGFFGELRPNTASIVWDINKHQWQDGQWLESRKNTNWLESPIAIYEVHLGSWSRKDGDGFFNYRELAHMLVDYAHNMGYSHLELLPVMEHPLDESWGYQTLGYFSATSRFGTPDDLKYFMDHCHRNNIGVILDWVPAHFPKDAHGLAYFDGTFLYEHAHPFQREHMDWGTHIFNYGRNEVANFLLNSALFWLNEYHADGLRVDAVASMLYLNYSREEGQWIPNKFGGNENIEAIEFIKRFNELCHKEFPGVLTVAEESTAWPMVSRPTYMGGLGFGLKWNMGWMHDVLSYFTQDPVHRKYHHHNLTFGLIYAFHENFVLVLSHDEVVHGKRSILDKMPGDMWQKFANVRLLYGFMYAHPGKKMMFMGGEFGQWIEWNANKSLDWHLLQYEPHQKLQSFIQDLNRMYTAEPSMHQQDFSVEGFQWIDYGDADSSVLCFIRRAKDPRDFTVFVFNFTPVVRENYRVGVPVKLRYAEVLNSDSEAYWGSNVGNGGMVVAEDVSHNLWPHSIKLTLPPLGMLAFRPVYE